MIEFLAALFTLISAYYTVKEKTVCWPQSIISSALYIYLLLQQHLYGQVFINVITMAQCTYGWWWWKITTSKNKYSIRNSLMITQIFQIAFLSLLLGKAFQSSDNPQPYLDMFTTLLGLLGNWYLAKRILQGFMVWIIADIGLIVLFFEQKMYWSAGLYFLLIGFALQGHLQWKKDSKMV